LLNGVIIKYICESMFYKSIIQGRLSFGTQKSYDKVVKMFEYRTETYYKSDIMLILEDVFNPEELCLYVPRFVGNASDKNFKNTIDLLSYCSQFAVAGSMQAWMIEDGKVLNHANISPDSDRTVVTQFKKGDKLFREKGKSTEALEAFSKTIESFEKHAQAYERRGWVNLRLKNYSDALYDFNKAIKLDDSIAFAYYGKGIISANEGNIDEATECFTQTVKKSVALESLHWRGRLRKAECLIESEEWEKAVFELKFFTKRKFDEKDSNYRRRPKAFALYGKVLTEMGEHKDAIAALDEAINLHTEEMKEMNVPEAYYDRGRAKKALGVKDFQADLKKATKLGSKKAKEMLAAK